MEKYVFQKAPPYTGQTVLEDALASGSMIDSNLITLAYHANMKEELAKSAHAVYCASVLRNVDEAGWFHDFNDGRESDFGQRRRDDPAMRHNILLGYMHDEKGCDWLVVGLKFPGDHFWNRDIRSDPGGDSDRWCIQHGAAQ